MSSQQEQNKDGPVYFVDRGNFVVLGEHELFDHKHAPPHMQIPYTIETPTPDQNQTPQIYHIAHILRTEPNILKQKIGKFIELCVHHNNPKDITSLLNKPMPDQSSQTAGEFAISVLGAHAHSFQS
jgi:hypothetical protein